MSESLYNIDKRVVFRETFQSADSVRKNGGSVSSNITFVNGKCYMNDASSRITYKPFKINSNTTLRLRYKILNGTTTLGSESSPCFGVYSAVNSRYYITFDNNGYIGVMVSGAGTSSGIVPDYNEHEIVITRTAFYMDGVLLTTLSTGTATPNAQLIIGSLGSGFNGVIEYSLAEIYNKPLTASEVKLLYNNNLYSTLPAVITDNTPNCFEGNAPPYSAGAYIEVPDNDLLTFGDGAGNDQPFWMSCWVYINTFFNGMGFIDKNTGGYEYGLHYNGAFDFNINSRNGNIPRVDYEFFNPLLKTGFYHITVQYDLSNVYGYVNGQLIGTKPINPAYGGTYIGMTPTTSPVRIGIWQFYYPTNNKIWDVRIGSGTLTTQQVQDIYQGKRVGTERLWLPLCENAGNTRFDVSGNNLHGTLKGTQDGKYNVGKQNKFDYYTLFGGSVAAIYQNSPANSGVFINTSVYFPSNIINQTTWTIAIRGYYLPVYGGSGTNILFGNSSQINSARSIWLLNNGSNIGVRMPTIYNFTALTTNISNRYVSLIFRSDGSNVYLSVDGSIEEYITLTNPLLVFNCLNGAYANGGNSVGCGGYFWDLRTWNSDIGNTEALKYHNDEMTITPDHHYKLYGNNPTQDLTGNINGNIIAARPIAIPLQASNQQPVLPAMTDVTTALPVVQRSFREVFRLNANKGIVDQYGKPLTINGNVKIKQVGKSKGIYFGGTTSDYINCGNILNTELKDGFVIKMWYKPITIISNADVFTLKNSFLRYGANNTLRFNINNGGSVNVLATIKLNLPTLYIISIDREVSTSFCFNGSTFIGQTNLTGQYFIPNTNSLIFGSLTVPSKFILFDVSISTAGILSLEEATNIFSSEKNNFLP
jgi:hypothetical protein